MYCYFYLYISFVLQPLARMGATVTGVDAVEKNINIARLHAVCLVYKFDYWFFAMVVSSLKIV